MNKANKVISRFLAVSLLFIASASYLEYMAFAWEVVPNTLSVYFRLLALVLIPMWVGGHLMQLAIDPVLRRVLRKLRYQESRVNQSREVL